MTRKRNSIVGGRLHLLHEVGVATRGEVKSHGVETRYGHRAHDPCKYDCYILFH